MALLYADVPLNFGRYSFRWRKYGNPNLNAFDTFRPPSDPKRPMDRRDPRWRSTARL